MADEHIDERRLAVERANTLTEVKNQLAVESAKSLFLMNGGGAIAVATWLQAVWDRPWAPPMLPWQLIAILVFAIGVLAAGFAYFARFRVFYHPNTLKPPDNPWWHAHVNATWLSMGCFAVAAILAVIGGFVALLCR